MAQSKSEPHSKKWGCSPRYHCTVRQESTPLCDRARSQDHNITLESYKLSAEDTTKGRGALYMYPLTRQPKCGKHSCRRGGWTSRPVCQIRVKSTGRVSSTPGRVCQILWPEAALRCRPISQQNSSYQCTCALDAPCAPRGAEETTPRSG